MAAEAASETSRDDQLGFQLFAVLAGLAALVLFAERDYALTINRGLVPMPVVVPVALGAALAAFPGSVWLFLAYFAAQTYFLLLGFPTNNTNQTLTFFIGLGVLGGAAACMWRARSMRVSGAELFRVFAPVLRVCTVTLYFWTIWHKLNFDFLNPETSCASRLTVGMIGALGIRADPDLFGPPGVIMTVLVESALPIGLFFARTQRATALLGFAFHWMLGNIGFSGFSSTMFCLLSLFLAPLAGQAFSGYAGHTTANRAVLGVFLALHLLARLGVPHVEGTVWFSLPLVVFGLYRLNRGVISGGPRLEPPYRTILRPTPLLLVPLAMFLNGASPFLGFKTEYSFAMYSNLRTEGGRSNHVLWRTPLGLAGYQRDLVELLPGTDERLFRDLGGRKIPRYELTSSLYRLGQKGEHDVRVVVADGGTTRDIKNGESSPLAVKPGFFERRLLSFRKIVRPIKGECAH